MKKKPFYARLAVLLTLVLLLSNAGMYTVFAEDSRAEETAPLTAAEEADLTVTENDAEEAEAVPAETEENTDAVSTVTEAEAETAGQEGAAEDAEAVPTETEEPALEEEAPEGEEPAVEEEAAPTEEPASTEEEPVPDEDGLINYIEEDWNSYVWPGFLEEEASALRPKAVLSLRVVTFKSAVNKDYVLDIKGAGVANGTKMQLYKNNGTDAQKFIVKTNSDGTVSLISYMCGKALQLVGGSTSNGTQFELQTVSGESSQKFKLVKNSDGTVTIKHNSSGKAVDVLDGVAANCRKVQLYTSKSSKSQKFEMAETTEYRADFSGKTWLIRTRLNNASVLHVSGVSKANSANICISTSIKNGAQLYKVEPYGGYYRIVNTNSGKVIDCKSGKSAVGTNIQQYAWNGTKAQLWKIRLNNDGSVTFLSALSNARALEVKDGGTKKGTNVLLGAAGTDDKQKFFIVDSSRDFPAVYTTNTGATASSAANKKVLVNMIGAVESGGQVYGNQNYAAYADPYAVSSLEHTITLGWAQNYGEEAKELISRIFKKGAAAFRAIDKDGQVEEMLAADKDWVKMRWDPSEYKTTYKVNGKQLTLKDVLISLITSPNGKAAQDELFFDLMSTHISTCEKTYTKDVRAVLMYCQIRHLGGKTAVDRVFTRVNGNYSMDSLMAALAMDRFDMKSDNQVGDDKYWSRHEKCREFIQTYAVP